MTHYTLYPTYRAETIRQTELLREAEQRRQVAEAKAARQQARQEALAAKINRKGRQLQPRKEKLGWN